MAQILNKVRDVDPNNSEAVKEILSTFFRNINKYAEVDCNRWMRALEDIINRFPKYCMSHRNTIETYLVNFLSSNNYGTVIGAAKCAHVLQQVRPTQEKSATAKSCWRDQVSVLCSAVQSLLDSIFPNAVDIYKGNQSEEEQIQSSNSPLLAALRNINTTKGLDKNVNKQSVFCTRLRNVFIFLQAMLVEIYPVAKPIQPQKILEVLVRALSITSSDKSQIIQNVCAIKIQALRTVDALIASLGSNLVPFSALVTRFVMQTLRWSSENTSEESSKVRCAAYSTLVRWLGVLHAHCISNDDRARSWEDELANHITNDITPVKHVMQLTMSSQPTKNLSKKARRKLANSMLQESNIASHMPGEKNKITVSEQINDEVAIAALECAETFLTVCGIFLKPTTHKIFQERLVRECYTSESYSSDRALALLRALEAERKSTPPTVPPPTQYCLQLYSTMINSQQHEISKFCTQALLDIRLHLHCSPPSLNFAIEVTEDKLKKTVNKRKKMSERNRATLDALLGFRSDAPENTEEVITIQDEPARKKPRLDEEIADKISVSSDSDLSSVEISDDSDEDVEIVPVMEVDKSNDGTEGDISMGEEEIDGSTVNTINEEVDEQTDNTVNKKIEELTDITVIKKNDEQNDITVIKEIDVQTDITVIKEIDKQTDITISIKTDKQTDITLNKKIHEQTENIVQSVVSDLLSKPIETIDNPESVGSDLLSKPIETIDNPESSKEQNIPITQSAELDLEQNQTQSETSNIFDARTQLPLDVSNDATEDDIPLSAEIAYDLPNTAKEVPVLGKMDDENLPSTNDTDDIQITCGQTIKSSQDAEADKTKEPYEKNDDVPKVNGNKSPVKMPEDDSPIPQVTESVTVKITTTEVVSIDDMLADFVDEVNEDNKT